ncbi:hypothetical protein PPMP20_27550 [Paraburkholderia phymatum]|uniref:hypothetical protein n=1 Tax=Paraburkholderia phymatum TaxID=148447 RepID=UPI00030B2149|nr:hypothetical protein [Paraburkholderia phymatum]
MQTIVPASVPAVVKKRQRVDPIIEAWKRNGDKPRAYTAGTFGPGASTAMMARDNMVWSEES